MNSRGEKDTLGYGDLISSRLGGFGRADHCPIITAVVENYNTTTQQGSPRSLNDRSPRQSFAPVESSGLFSEFNSANPREERVKPQNVRGGCLSEVRAPRQQPLSRTSAVVRPMPMFSFTAFKSIFSSIYQ